MNLLNPTPVVDPITGVKLMPVNGAGDWGWRQGANWLGLPSSYTQFSYWTGGSGWSNPGDILNENTSDASTSNTNPLDLYSPGCCTNPADPWNGISVDDIGIVPWASATNSSGNNAQFTLCIFTNPSSGCLGTPITVTGSNRFSQIQSGSADPDQPFPAAFPSAFYSGWGLIAPLGPDHLNTQGTLSCAASVCQVSGVPTRTSYFPDTMLVGQKIYIAGSAPTCANNLCTLSSYQNQGQVTISEPLTIGPSPFTALMWGVRVQKVTSAGTLTVGLAFKQAGARQLDQASAGNWTIAPLGFFSGDGHFGFLATYSQALFPGKMVVYFVSGDGTVRRVWTTRVPSDASCFTPNNTADQPSGQDFEVSNVSFSATDAKTFYVANNNSAGGLSLYQVTYTGDAYSSVIPNNYTASMDGNYPLYASPCDNTAWVNLMPASTNNDFASQLAAYRPTYNAALYGGASAFSLAAFSGTTALLQNSYSGQNNPSWLAVIDLSTNPATLRNMIHTLDGTGTTNATTSVGPAAIRWGGHHNASPAAVPNTFVLSENTLGANNSSLLLSGPFEAAPLAVLEADGTTWNTNTSLPWPPDNTYFTSCPSLNPYASLVYATSPGGNPVTDDCVTLKFPAGGVCNLAAGAIEKANFPACPWNTNYTQPVALAIGDNFTDVALNGGLGDTGDSEHFRIVQITTNGDGSLSVTAMRNAIFDYCAVSPTYFPNSTINNGLDNPGQLQHSNGWTVAMNPARLNGCTSGIYFYQYSSAGSTIAEEGRIEAGSHGGLFPGLTRGNYSLLSASTAKTNVPFSQLFNLPTVYSTLASPTFQGQGLPIGAGAVQSYVTTPGTVPWMTDANALNGNFGSGPELNYNTIGSVTLTQVAGSVFTITPIAGVPLTNANYKLYPLLGFAGRYLLRDVSGPSSNISLSPWGICYVYAAGECYTGSAQGTLYVNVPGAYNSGACNTGQSFLLAPCVVLGFPSGGGFRLQRITQSDTDSQGSVLLTYGLTAPGEHYPFTGAEPLPDGSALLLGAHETQGWGDMAWLVRLPPFSQRGITNNFQTDSTNRTQLEYDSVTVPPGFSFAEVQFGYSRFIGPNASPGGTFFCTQRADGCNTSGTPYNFESESRSLTSCSGGCAIRIPVMTPNLVYYRIRQSNDGVSWTAGDVQVLAKP